MARLCGHELAGCGCPPPPRSLTVEILDGGWEPDEHRWSLGARIFWTLVAASAFVLAVIFVPTVAVLATAVVPPVSSKAKHAREVPYPVLAFLVDMIALLARPLWSVTDRVSDAAKAVRAWFAVDPGRWEFVIDAVLLVGLFAVVLIGGLG